MSLEMKSVCEKCLRALGPADEAQICSFECTFCPECARELRGDCPNCGGELVRRPRRSAASAVDAARGDTAGAASAPPQCPGAA
jgi:hypothetical protein